MYKNLWPRVGRIGHPLPVLGVGLGWGRGRNGSSFSIIPRDGSALQCHGRLNAVRPGLQWQSWTNWHKMQRFCSNIHTLYIDLIDQPNDLHNEIVRLKKLKDINISSDKYGIDPEEVTCVAFLIKTTFLISS